MVTPLCQRIFTTQRKTLEQNNRIDRPDLTGTMTGLTESSGLILIQGYSPHLSGRNSLVRELQDPANITDRHVRLALNRSSSICPHIGSAREFNLTCLVPANLHKRIC